MRGSQRQSRRGTGSDQLALAGGEPREQRDDRDNDQPAYEDAPPAEQVGGAASEQQEAAEGDQVCVDHPGEVLIGEVETLADAQKGDVDDCNSSWLSCHSYSPVTPASLALFPSVVARIWVGVRIALSLG